MWDILTPPSSPAAARSLLWLAACRYCREERPVVRFAPVALWAVLSLAAYQLIENPQWREFAYYNLRAVLQLVCYGLLAWWYTHSPTPSGAPS